MVGKLGAAIVAERGWRCAVQVSGTLPDDKTRPAARRLYVVVPAQQLRRSFVILSTRLARLTQSSQSSTRLSAGLHDQCRTGWLWVRGPGVSCPNYLCGCRPKAARNPAAQRQRCSALLSRGSDCPIDG